MKKFIVFSTIIVSVIAIIFGAQRNIVNIADDGMSDNISERQYQEWLMLRDPALNAMPHNIKSREKAYIESLSNMISKQESALSSEWASRGPWNVGGRTRALAIDVDNSNVILAGGVSGGMWRSMDSGISWEKTFAPQSLHSVTTIAQDTRQGKTNTWYVGSGEIYGNSAEISGDGLLKSTDNGKSWFPLAATASGTPNRWDGPFDYVWRVAVDHTQEQDVVYAACALGGIQRSTDGGETWKSSLASFGNNSSYFTELSISPTCVLYATLSSVGSNNSVAAIRGIFRSTDGISWTNITPASFPGLYRRISIGISPSDEDVVYFLAHTPGSGFKSVAFNGDEDWNSLFRYRYISGDGSGVQGVWENLSENIPGFNGSFGDYNAQGSYNSFVKVHPTNPNTVFLGGTNIYVSTDGYSTKTKWNWVGGYKPGSKRPDYQIYPNHHPDNHELLFHPSNPSIVYSAHDGGVSRTEDILADTVKWSELTAGYVTSQFYTLALKDVSGDNHLLGGLQDNGTLFSNSADKTKPWAAPGLGDGSYCAFGANNRVYMSRQLGKMEHYELDNEGKVLKKGRFDPIGGKDYLFINPFILDPDDNTKMYLAGGKSIWKNNNLLDLQFGHYDSVSTNWNNISATEASDRISALDKGKNSKKLYYGTIDGKVYCWKNTDDFNSEVENISQNMPSGYVSCISVNPDDDNHVIVVYSNYNIQSLFATYDGGDTWTAIGGNLEINTGEDILAPSCKWAATLKVGEKTVYYVGTSVGLFSTTYLNGLSTVWVQEGAETIGNMPIAMIKTRQSDNLVVAATHGSGVYSATVTSYHIAAPDKIELEFPENNIKNVLESQSVRWKKNDASVYYELQCSLAEDFSELLPTDKSLQGLSSILYDLPQGLKTVYWRVRGINAGGAGLFSETRTFVSAVAAPLLLSPGANETEVNRLALLRWESSQGAEKYHLQVSTSLLFTQIAMEDSTLETTEKLTSELEANKKYYWRLRAGNHDGFGLFSQRSGFTTGTAVSVQQDPAAVQAMFPQPATSFVNIPANDIKNIPLQISIISLKGELMMKQQLIPEGGYLRVAVHTLPIGTYKAIISTSGRATYSHTFVKQ